MASLKDRLLSRERPVAHYPCRVESVEDTEAAEKAFALARKVALAVRADDKQAAAKAKKALDAAEKKRDGCYERITLRAMEPTAFEDLQDAYPQSESEDQKDHQAADEAYLHAVFLGTVEGDGMSEEDWTNFVHKNLSTGERNDLYNTAIAVNGRVRALDPATPKG